MKKTARLAALVALALASSGSLAPPARAVSTDRTNCIVTSVRLQQNSSAGFAPMLVFACANDTATYGTFVGAPDCGFFGAPTIDILKSWQSMLQTALLSGRPVDFQKDASCGGGGFSARLVSHVTLK